ncbi:SDR family NAD(P)-dependent oxidoreductase [Paracandidimonas soli]|uniref:3-oxoacyl-[acyl-carrier protein] reductase n=1 Tax=Paracandidimonas soli TaxID=1917182 RepID=A0A4V2VS25_9BURK|nr:SDR family NAD(P)-dependent oxidoreductase [Paracandidimonas soli]TCV00730.1 3-oxoacyl-[acyl-carrier protein] reductase [Paracandidimonas soli]
MQRLKNKIAVVTGGSSGIGLAIAERFSSEGARIISLDLNEAADKPHIHFIKTDVSSSENVNRSFAQIAAEYDKVDVLINNAGISWSIPMIDITDEQWAQMLAIHLNGSFYCARAASRLMIDTQTPGAIINMSSVSGIVGSDGRAAYGAAKGGIITLTRVMAVELAQHRITVNSIAPGPILTPLIKNLWEDVKEYPRDVPLKRFGMPEEIAHAALFLSSDEARFITGIVLPVDGGFSITGKVNRDLPTDGINAP